MRIAKPLLLVMTRYSTALMRNAGALWRFSASTGDQKLFANVPEPITATAVSSDRKFVAAAVGKYRHSPIERILRWD